MGQGPRPFVVYPPSCRGGGVYTTRKYVYCSVKTVLINTLTTQTTHTHPERDMQNTYKRYFETSSCNHCCRMKAISTSYSECVFVPLVIQNPKHTRRVTMSSVACRALPCLFPPPQIMS